MNEKKKFKPQKGLAQFNRNIERMHSAEYDYGGWWTANGKPSEWPRFTVSWIEDTGELYAWNSPEDLYQVLGRFDTEAAVEQAMEGWADPDSPIYHNLNALIKRLGC